MHDDVERLEARLEEARARARADGQAKQEACSDVARLVKELDEAQEALANAGNRPDMSRGLICRDD